MVSEPGGPAAVKAAELTAWLASLAPDPLAAEVMSAVVDVQRGNRTADQAARKFHGIVCRVDGQVRDLGAVLREALS